MARERVEKVTCDRCNKIYEENAKATEDPIGSKVTLESFAGNISFEDLCPRCEKRVASLVESILMVKDDEKESKPSKKSKKGKGKGSTKSPPGVPVTDEAKDNSQQSN
jgi:hypothetical protein